MALPSKVSLRLVASCLLAAAVPRVAAAQNISIDGRFSPAKTLYGPNYAIGANLGKQVGSNLFHSFGQFSLVNSPIRESATFSGPATISNIIGRVTGGNPSSIDGQIKSTIPGANLYLINPNGIVFGPSATVNVSGSFHASTADYLKLSDGAKFQATNPDGSTLSYKPPVAFGFLTARPAAITVNGSTLGPMPGTLGMVAGPISINGATLSAPAGTIHMTSSAGTGEVPVDPRNTPALTVTSFGPVDIKGSTLDVSDPKNLGNGGNMFIRSGALTIDSSEINGDNYGSGPGGQLVLQADSKITLSNRANIDTANIHALAQSSGGGGDIVIRTSPDGGISVDNTKVAVGSLAMGDSGQLSVATGRISLTNGAALKSEAQASGAGGPITISAGSVVLDGGAALDQSTGILSTTSGAGTGGSISIVAGELALHNGAGVLAQSTGGGGGGGISLSVGGSLAVDSGASLGTVAYADGNAGDVSVVATRPVTIDMAVGADSSILGGIGSLTKGAGNAGNVSVTAGAIAIANSGSISSETAGDGNHGNSGMVIVGAETLSIASNGVIAASTFASGNAGSVTVSVSGQLTIDGSGGDPRFGTGIFSQANMESSGAAGTVRVDAANLIIRNTAGRIAANTFASGDAGSVSISAGTLAITSNGAIEASTFASGNAGSVNVSAGTLSIASNGVISASSTFGSGNAGNVFVAVSGQLTIDGSGGNPGAATGIFSQANPQSSGAAGPVSVSAGTLVIANDGVISSTTFGSGNAGSVMVAVSGQLTIDGSGGNPGAATGIFSEATPQSSGAAGPVSVSAGTLVIANDGVISSTTFASGNAGSVMVAVSGQLTINGSSEKPRAATGIFSETTPQSSGAAGTVNVSAGTLVIANDGVISSRTMGFGNGGSVLVTAGNLAIVGDGRIATDTLGTDSGNAGSVSVNVAGRLTIDGVSQSVFTGISSRSTQGSDGKAGDIKVSAGSLSIGNTGEISTSTDGSGAGGTVAVAVTGDTALSGGALITSATAGAGNGGTIVVTAGGVMTLTGPGTGITASATSTATGNAGSVMVAAPQIALMAGSEISSTAAGTGAGGKVTVTTPGVLVLDGAGDANTQIAASATGPQSGSGGSVTVNADTLTIRGKAEIASSTAGPGRGGDVNVTVASDIVLPDRGPQITAKSTSSGDMGSVTVSAVRLLMNNGAAISTEAETSTASGGNITLRVRDLLYLVNGEITTSVKGETGSGGNIVIDPPLVILNHSSIIAEAVKGHGGNVTVNAGEFIASADSIVSATSQLGISGTVEISGPRVDVNGALVVLSTVLRNAAEVLRESCSAQGSRPQSSLVEAGRGGLPQDPEATLPALYIAGRDLNLNPQATADSTEASSALSTTVRLTMRCG